MSSQDFEGRGAGSGGPDGERDEQAGAGGVSGGVSGEHGIGGGAGGERGGAVGGAAENMRRLFSGDEVAGYAAEVRSQFADLSDAESAELLEDLEDHLREVAAEGAGTLRERLGAPAAYARELRQAAGLPEPGQGSGSGGGARSRRSLREVLAEAERWARGYRAGREVLDFLPSLRPAWWVLRAWVVVRLLEVVTTSVDPWHEFEIVPRIGNSTFVGFLALLVAIPVSVYAARQTVPDGWRRRAMGAGEGILALFAVVMALSAMGNQDAYANTSGASYVQTQMPGLADNGQVVTNLFVYDHSGKLLDGALVYDQNGRPVSVAQFGGDGSFVDSGGWLDGNGALIPNAFPRQVLQQQWDGTGSGPNYVAVPPPAVNVPQGVHRATVPTDPQQNSATPSSVSQTPSTSSSSSGPASPSPTSSSSAGGATGARPSSVLPSTPQPSSTTG